MPHAASTLRGGAGVLNPDDPSRMDLHRRLSTPTTAGTAMAGRP